MLTILRKLLNFSIAINWEICINYLIIFLILGFPITILFLVFYIISPKINPEKNVDLGNVKPKNLFS